MLVGTDAAKLQQHLHLISRHGRAYGLELNVGKTLLLRVRHDGQVVSDEGEPIKAVDQAVYLGGLLTADGTPRAELTRRLGEASGVFKKLDALWKHANLPRSWKKRVLDACVVPKLMYGLESLCLRKADQQRLDSFYVKCLRRIYGIPHSYISRVSNYSVLHAAQAQPLSRTLLARQLVLYGRIARMPEHSYVRQIALGSNTILPRKFAYSKKVGRPRLQWTTYVYAMATTLAEDFASLEHSMLSPVRWAQKVREWSTNQ